MRLGNETAALHGYVGGKEGLSMIYALIAVAAVLCAVWLWLNVILVKDKEDTPAKSGNHRVPVERRDEAGAQQPVAPANTSVAPHRLAAAGGARPVFNPDLAGHTDDADANANDARPEDAGAVHSPVSTGERADDPTTLDTSGSPDDSEDPAVAVSDVEVLSQTGSGSKSVFRRENAPFRLYTHRVPMFATDTWQRVFTRLTEEPWILGWIAFQDKRVGAADSDYEESLIAALCEYWQMANRLRLEVGLSSFMETSIQAEEGKVWLITAVDDAWLALFVDADADPRELTHTLLDDVHQD